MTYTPKMLVVDDNTPNRKIIQSLFKKQGIEIHEAKSGNEAILMANENQYDVILMDIQMPGLNGFEATEIIKKDEKNHNVPIIFLSAVYSSEHYKLVGLKSGGVEFITKPYDDEYLRGKVNIFLESQRLKKELTEVNLELEKRVKERTEELETAKNKLADALKKEKEMVEMKSLFISMISHEYRTPLTIIQSTNEIIKGLVEKEQCESIIDRIKISERAVNSLDRLIENVFTLNNKFVDTWVEKTDFNLIKLLNEITEFYCNGNSCSYTINNESETEIIHSDSSLFRIIFSKLIENCVRYSKDEIEIEINVFISDYLCKVVISDNGLGIKEEDLGRIFEPFYRAKEHIGLVEGTGLGLSIMKKYLDVLQGSIKVESVVGEGTDISVKIPL